MKIRQITAAIGARFWAALFFTAVTSLGLASCDRNEGPVEEAAETVDEQAEEVGDALEDAAEEAEDAAEEAEDAAEEAEDAVEEAADN